MINIRSYDPPQTPGVYIFKDMGGNPLYIGKAKNLKKRIMSYATPRTLDWKITALIQDAQNLDWITTESEEAALLLEADLISSYMPMYNKLLSGNTPFIYIVAREKRGAIPQFSLARIFDEQAFENALVGPFLERKSAKKILDYIVKEFNLGTCNKTIERGCLAYHLGSCSGTCMKRFNKDDYQKRFELAKKALSLETEQFLSYVKERIDKAKKNYDFEEAKHLMQYYECHHSFIKTLYSFSPDQKTRIEEALFAIDMKYEMIAQGLKEIGLWCGLSKTPHIIDCIDISHFQGQALVGAVVRFTGGIYDRAWSKHYNLKKIRNDDYKALQETIALHYHDQHIPFPDILLIDGGKGQLHASQHCVPKTLPLIALAKREERLFTNIYPDGICISHHTPGGKLLISLRNATHNSAIFNHRTLFTL